ncbi:hypothetical protein HDU67_008846 [Dinochytrium kinnereticum]|nr:hypothetical protein HDU67_008846 [Dinochytrium kinnereticum]
MSWFKKRQNPATAAPPAVSSSSINDAASLRTSSASILSQDMTVMSPQPAAIAPPVDPTTLQRPSRLDDQGTSSRAAALSAVRLNAREISKTFTRQTIPSDVPCEASFQNERHVCNADVAALVEVTEDRIYASKLLKPYKEVDQVSALCPARYLELSRLSLSETIGTSIMPVQADDMSGLESLTHLILYTSEEIEKLDRMVKAAVDRIGSTTDTEVPTTQLAETHKAAFKFSRFLFENMHQESIRQWILVWFFPMVVEGIDTFDIPDFMANCQTIPELAQKIVFAADNLLSDAYPDPGGDILGRAGDDRTSETSSDGSSTATNGSEAPSNKVPLNSPDVVIDVWTHIINIYLTSLESHLTHTDGPKARSLDIAEVEDMERIIITLAVCTQRFVVTSGIMAGTLAAMRCRLNGGMKGAKRVPAIVTIIKATARVSSASAFAAGCLVLSLLMDIEILWASKGLQPVIMTRNSHIPPPADAPKSPTTSTTPKILPPAFSVDPETPDGMARDALRELLKPDHRWSSRGPSILIPTLRVLISALQSKILSPEAGSDILENIAEYTNIVFTSPDRIRGKGPIIPSAVIRVIAGAYKEIKKNWPVHMRWQFMLRVNDILELRNTEAELDRSSSLSSPRPRRALEPYDVLSEKPFRKWVGDFQNALGDGDGPTLFSGKKDEKGGKKTLPLDLPDAELDALLDEMLKENEVALSSPAARVLVARRASTGGWTDLERWNLLEDSVVTLSRIVLNKTYNE